MIRDTDWLYRFTNSSFPYSATRSRRIGKSDSKLALKSGQRILTADCRLQSHKVSQPEKLPVFQLLADPIYDVELTLSVKFYVNRNSGR